MTGDGLRRPHYGSGDRHRGRPGRGNAVLSGAAGPGFLVKGQFTPEAAEGSQRATHTRRHGEDGAPRGVRGGAGHADGAPRGVRGGLGMPTVGTEGCAGRALGTLTVGALACRLF